MRWADTLRLRLRSLFRRGRVEDELEAELAYHLDRLVEQLVAAGLTPADARLAALREIGGLEQRKEECRDARGVAFLHDLAGDVRLAVRSLRRRPGFLAVALGTTAIGISASTALFSLVDGVLLRPLPYPHPERLVALFTTSVRRGGDGVTSYPDFADWRAQARSFEEVAAYHATGAVIGGAEPQHVPGASVSGGFFRVLGVAPTRGRVFGTELDERPERVVVLSDAVWRRRFGAAEGAVGRQLVLDGEPFTIAGILPPDFRPPVGARGAELFLPLALEGGGLRSRGGRSLEVIGRLRADATLAHARAELATIARRLEQAWPDSNQGRGVAVRALHEVTVRHARGPLLLLSAAVAFLLLIAATNVAHLLLPRALERRHEIALRLALGASRFRVARLVLVETLLLWLLGAAAGIAVAAGLVKVLVTLAPAGTPRLDEIGIDPRVLAFGIASALACGIAFGLFPALQATRVQPAGSLRGRTPALSGHRLAGGLVAVEMALAVVLLVGAGLTLESLRRLVAEPPGFDADGVLTAELTLPSNRYPTPASRRQFYDSLLRRLRSLPGVSQTGLVTPLPFSADSISIRVSVPGRDVAPSDRPRSLYHAATSEYFRAMRLPLRSGRLLSDDDTSGAPPVAVVNEAFAARVFPGEDPLGRRVHVGVSADAGEPETFEIVGVVGNVHEGNLRASPDPDIFVPQAQHTWPWAAVVLRTTVEPQALAPAVRRAVGSLDPQQAVTATRTMRERVSGSLAIPRFVATLLSLFAAVAAALAAVGLYGVLAAAVVRRRAEIAVRMAVGARVADVLRLVAGDTARMAGVGIAAGVATAAALTRLMTALLFGVGPRDARTFLTVVVGLSAVALAAAVVPAWRAARIDPAAALRRE